MKKVWADYEQLVRPVISLFKGEKILFFYFFENTVAYALKSCIIPFLQKKFHIASAVTNLVKKGKDVMDNPS